MLVGDIDRGGVFAQIVGTKTVIDPADAAMIRGFIVNRFRGDPSLFSDGMRMIAERTGLTPEPTEVLGWDGDAVEAQGFAYMAVRTLLDLPISFPGTTGVPRPMTGGTVHRP